MGMRTDRTGWQYDGETAKRPLEVLRRSVFVSYSLTASLRIPQQSRRCAREISNHDVGSRAPDAKERFHHRALRVNPAAFGRCLNHSVLAAYLVRGDRITHLGFDAMNDV